MKHFVEHRQQSDYSNICVLKEYENLSSFETSAVHEGTMNQIPQPLPLFTRLNVSQLPCQVFGWRWLTNAETITAINAYAVSVKAKNIAVARYENLIHSLCFNACRADWQKPDSQVFFFFSLP